MVDCNALKHDMIHLLRHLAALIVGYLAFCLVGGLYFSITMPALNAFADWFDSVRGVEVTSEAVARTQWIHFLGLILVVIVGVVLSFLVARRLFLIIAKN